MARVGQSMRFLGWSEAAFGAAQSDEALLRKSESERHSRLLWAEHSGAKDRGKLARAGKARLGVGDEQ